VKPPTLSMTALVQRACEQAEDAVADLKDARSGINNTDEERVMIARALAELKDAVVCLEATLARL
jgi:HPt (histidine-containing phosphotransfer) domain-containing protein